MKSEGEPIRVTVVGGYLGSGKTTLVNSVLRRADARFAVLVNDFGEVNIDAALVDRDPGGDGDETGVIRLANGCICCSMADGLASALSAIANFQPRPERLLIEASGVSDPASVAAYGHAPGFAVDATIVLADADSVMRRSRDKYVGDTVTQQLGAADMIVLNKVTLARPGVLGSTRSWLTERWPSVPIVESDYGEVPLGVLVGPSDPSEEAAAIPCRPGDPNPEDPNPGPHAHPGHGSHARFETWTIRQPGPVSRQSLEAFMADLPAGVVRVKGFVGFSDPTVSYLLQRVGSRWTIEETDRAPSDETVLVLIGHPGAFDPTELGLGQP